MAPVVSSRRSRTHASSCRRIDMTLCTHPLVHAAVIGIATSAIAGCGTEGNAQAGSQNNRGLSPAMIAEGQRIFRFDTFGDEQLWTDQLRMNEVVETIDPITALSLGLKVDSEALPPGILDTVELDDPATTVA